MANMNWGLSDAQITESIDGAPATNAVWKSLPEIKQGTMQLTTEAGERVEALDERGDVVDTRTAKSKYKLEFQIFVKKGDTRPIEDVDGVIIKSYAIRVTPGDETCPGFQMDNCSVAVEETWSVADGQLLKYTFSGLKPKSGKICKPYNKPAESDTSLSE